MFRGLKSLLAGIVAGTAIGVLFSPKKGKEFRKDIKKEINGGGIGLGAVKETLTEMGKDIGSSCKECYQDISKSDEFKKGKEKFKKAVDENVSKSTQEKAKSAYNKAKEVAKSAIERVKKLGK